jgi:hypothetical protein
VPPTFIRNDLDEESYDPPMGGAELWGEEYDANVTQADEDEFMTKINELINNHPEIL